MCLKGFRGGTEVQRFPRFYTSRRGQHFGLVDKWLAQLSASFTRLMSQGGLTRECRLGSEADFWQTGRDDGLSQTTSFRHVSPAMNGWPLSTNSRAPGNGRYEGGFHIEMAASAKSVDGRRQRIEHHAQTRKGARNGFALKYARRADAMVGYG